MIDDGLSKKPPRQPTRDQLKKLENEPEVDWGTMFLARGYAELSTEKPIGFSGRGPIPWTRMVKWCQFHRLSHATATHAMTTVSHVDGIFMRRDAAKAKAEAAAAKKPKGRR